MIKQDHTTDQNKALSFLGFLCRLILIFLIITSVVFMLSKIADAAVSYNLKITQNER